MASTGIRIDDRHWPLVVVTFEEAVSDEAFETYLAGMHRCLARGEPHGYLVDARKGTMISGPQRAAQSAWLKRHEVDIKRYSVGTAVVLRSAALRFVLSAMYLLQAPITPTESFGTVDEAHAWLATTFSRAGLMLPPRRVLGS